MERNIVGRENEIKTLNQFLKSKRPEFLAIYGRRRVGKTFLIKEFFKAKPVVFFTVTGLKKGSMKEQIKHFTSMFSNVFYRGIELAAKKIGMIHLSYLLKLSREQKKTSSFSSTNSHGWQLQNQNCWKASTIIGINIGQQTAE